MSLLVSSMKLCSISLNKKYIGIFLLKEYSNFLGWTAIVTWVPLCHHFIRSDSAHGSQSSPSWGIPQWCEQPVWEYGRNYNIAIRKNWQCLSRDILIEGQMEQLPCVMHLWGQDLQHQQKPWTLSFHFVNNIKVHTCSGRNFISLNIYNFISLIFSVKWASLAWQL